MANFTAFFIEVLQTITVAQRMSPRWDINREGSGSGLVGGVQLTVWSLPTNLKTGTWKCFAR